MMITLQNLPRESPQALETNLTAYRSQMGDLINAMEADLNHVGYPDTGAFRALSDSVIREIGGGAGGRADGPKREELGQHVARARRLIGQYQQAMKTARK